MAWRAQEAEEEWTPPDPALPLYQLLTSKDGFLALQSYFLKAVMLSEREQVPSSLDASSPYLSAIAPVYQDTALSTPFRTGSIPPYLSFAADGLSFARILHSVIAED